MPVYLSETTPEDSRGLLTSFFGPIYVVGLLASQFANVGFERFDLGWRVAIGMAVVIGFASVIGSTFLPHSPR